MNDRHRNSGHHQERLISAADPGNPKHSPLTPPTHHTPPSL